MADSDSPPVPSTNFWRRLRLNHQAASTPIKNANTEHEKGLSSMDKVALWITDRVGSMSFFILILVWTILWCGYNIVATMIPALKWPSFDPFPAFVAYLLISNVIQILLMPLIMVGQNVQGRHSEIRAELDFEINQKAEKEVIEILRGLEHNTDLLIQLMKHMNCRIDDQEVRLLAAEKDTGAGTA
jgi:uncharacterized membrane protein